MTRKTKLTYERLTEVLFYDPKTGIFRWKEKPSKYSPVSEGEEAGYLHKPSGYIRVSIDSERYVCHRLAWLYTYKKWPEGDIDHVNGDRSDNRIENLREALDKNSWNAKIRSDNTSGVKGVSFHKGVGKYVARVNHKGKIYNLGCFNSLEAAVAVVKEKREELHGDFTNHG